MLWYHICTVYIYLLGIYDYRVPPTNYRYTGYILLTYSTGVYLVAVPFSALYILYVYAYQYIVGSSTRPVHIVTGRDCTVSTIYILYIYVCVPV